MKAQVFISSTSELIPVGRAVVRHLAVLSAGLRKYDLEFGAFYWQDEQPVTSDPTIISVVEEKIEKSKVFIGLLGQSSGSQVRLSLLSRLRRRKVDESILWTQFESELAGRHRLPKAFYLHRPDATAPDLGTTPSWWSGQWVKAFKNEGELLPLVEAFLQGCVARWLSAGTNTNRHQLVAGCSIAALLVSIISVFFANLAGLVSSELARSLVLAGVILAGLYVVLILLLFPRQP